MTDYDKTPGIPTTYRGIHFRSRLEAKWAAVLDLMGVHWEYEPLDLRGYIPDFICDLQLYAGQGKQPKAQTLLEVRPLWDATEYGSSIAKVARSGWTGAAVVLGATIRTAPLLGKAEHWFGYGHPEVNSRHAEAESREWFRVGWQATGPAAGMLALGGDADISQVWHEAGNLVQWLPPGR